MTRPQVTDKQAFAALKRLLKGKGTVKENAESRKLFSRYFTQPLLLPKKSRRKSKRRTA
jgi:hypothetical protein